MAGSFGYEAKHHAVSMQMAELSLLPAVRAAPDAIVVADGTSCRHPHRGGCAAPRRGSGGGPPRAWAGPPPHGAGRAQRPRGPAPPPHRPRPPPRRGRRAAAGAGLVRFLPGPAARGGHRPHLERILDPDSQVMCIVAEVDGQVYGFANCVVHENTWETQAVCYLEDLFVLAAARPRRAPALIEWLRNAMRAEGWARLYWMTRADNVRGPPPVRPLRPGRRLRALRDPAEMTSQVRGRPLRFRLFLLAASGLLPLAIVAAVVLGYLAGERERDARRTALAVSRALATAVDSELRATVGVLQSLALSDELQPAACANSMPWPAASPPAWAGAPWCWPTADGPGAVQFRAAARRGVSQPVDPESMRRALAPAPAGGGHGDRRAPQGPGLRRAGAGAAPGRAALRPVGRDPHRAHPGGAAAPVRALHLGGDGARPEPEPGGPLPAEPGPAAVALAAGPAGQRAAPKAWGRPSRWKACAATPASAGCRTGAGWSPPGSPRRTPTAASTACWARWAPACSPRWRWPPSSPGISRAT